MQIHLEKLVGKIHGANVVVLGGSEIENVGNLPNGWTDWNHIWHMRIHQGINIG